MKMKPATKRKILESAFSVESQLETTTGELDAAILDAQNALARFKFLMDEQQKQFHKKQMELDNIEIFTEAEAAARLKISRVHLGNLRRADNLPFVRLGDSVRYSKENLRDIVKILTVNEHQK
jgi:hypothetical protein